MNRQDNKYQGGTGLYAEKYGEAETVLWDVSSNLKEEKEI